MYFFMLSFVRLYFITHTCLSQELFWITCTSTVIVYRFLALHRKLYFQILIPFIIKLSKSIIRSNICVRKKWITFHGLGWFNGFLFFFLEVDNWWQSAIYRLLKFSGIPYIYIYIIERHCYSIIKWLECQ